MKRSFIICLTFLLVAAAILPAAAATPDTQPQHTITVTGHAEAVVSPDIAVATFGVQTSNADIETAKTENDRIMQAIYEAMLLSGIDRSKIKTSMFSVQPIYKSETGNSAERVTGYRVQNMTTVTIEDMQNIGRVIDTAFQAGANQFQGVRFGLKKEQTFRDELMKQALLDGKRKAEMMAEALGEKLGRPVSITENAYSMPVMAEDARVFSKAYQAGTPISEGTLTANADVHLIFELQ